MSDNALPSRGPGEPQPQNGHGPPVITPSPIPPPIDQTGPYAFRPPVDPTAAREKKRIPLRSILFAAFGVIAIGAVLLVYILKPPVPKHAARIGARLDLAAGDVTVGGNGPEQKALSGTPLKADASIGAGKGARALVRTGEGAAIFLRSETTLKLLDRGVELGNGEIWIDAPRLEGNALEVKSGA